MSFFIIIIFKKTYMFVRRFMLIMIAQCIAICSAREATASLEKSSLTRINELEQTLLKRIDTVDQVVRKGGGRR